MSEPRVPEQPGTASLERGRVAVLAAAQPLPENDDAIIEGLSDDEDRLFLEAIRDA